MTSHQASPKQKVAAPGATVQATQNSLAQKSGRAATSLIQKPAPTAANKITTPPPPNVAPMPKAAPTVQEKDNALGSLILSGPKPGPVDRPAGPYPYASPPGNIEKAGGFLEQTANATAHFNNVRAYFAPIF